MRHAITAFTLYFYASLVMAAGAELKLLHANPDLGDRVSLQRGARLFVNYCLSCHSLSFMRYSRLARDLGVSEEQVAENLLFAGEKVGDTMEVAMSAEVGANWFGVPPPDLSVVARARGADWLYSYLMTFYEDPTPTRPFGVNNVVFQDVGMPHVLWDLQGVQRYIAGDVPAGVKAEHLEALEAHAEHIAIHKTVELEDGAVEHVTDTLEVTSEGAMAPGQFRRAMRDLTGFLVYTGEPAQLERYTMGLWVLAFLAVFFALSYALYKEYWKDVH